MDNCSDTFLFSRLAPISTTSVPGKTGKRSRQKTVPEKSTKEPATVKQGAGHGSKQAPTKKLKGGGKSAFHSVIRLDDAVMEMPANVSTTGVPAAAAPVAAAPAAAATAPAAAATAAADATAASTGTTVASTTTATAMETTVGTTAAIPGNSLAAIISAVPVDSVESNVAQEHEPSGNDALQAMLASVPNGNGNDGAPDAEQLPPVLSRDAAFHINDYTRRQKGKKEVLACLTDRRDGTKATPFTIPGLSVDAGTSLTDKNTFGTNIDASVVVQSEMLALLRDISVGMMYLVHRRRKSSESFADFQENTQQFAGKFSAKLRAVKNGLIIHEKLPDGSLARMSGNTVIEPSWVFDAEVSVFFWCSFGRQGVSASIHRVVVRSRPDPEEIDNTSDSYGSQYN